MVSVATTTSLVVGAILYGIALGAGGPVVSPVALAGPVASQPPDVTQQTDLPNSGRRNAHGHDSNLFNR
jgi:hypothetical protein